MNRNRPIGVFDSGVGGLTVVKKIIAQLPSEDIIYFGDTARVPYGTKSPDTIIKFSIENIKFLLKFDVKLIVIACNTSSSLSLSFLQENFELPIIGVIEPGVEEAVRVSKNHRIGIIATPATVASRSYEKEIKQLYPKAYVLGQSCPLFVPLVEEGWIEDRITLEVAKRYLRSLIDAKIDTLILGCTHYPLLRQVIGKVMGNKVRLVDSAEATARRVKDILVKENLGSATKGKKPQYKFYVSDEPERFRKVGERFLNRKLEQIEKVSDS